MMNLSKNFIKPALLLLPSVFFYSCYSNVDNYIGSYQGTYLRDYYIGGGIASPSVCIVYKGSAPQSIRVLCNEISLEGDIAIDESGKAQTSLYYGEHPIDVNFQFENDSLHFSAGFCPGSPAGCFTDYFNGKKQ